MEPVAEVVQLDFIHLIQPVHPPLIAVPVHIFHPDPLFDHKVVQEHVSLFLSGLAVHKPADNKKEKFWFEISPPAKTQQMAEPILIAAPVYQKLVGWIESDLPAAPALPVRKLSSEDSSTEKTETATDVASAERFSRKE